MDILNYKAKTANQNGCFCIMIKQYDKAIDLFHNAICYNPLWVSPWLNAAVAYKAKGNIELSEEYDKMAEALSDIQGDAFIIPLPDFPRIPEPAKQAIDEFYKELGIP